MSQPAPISTGVAVAAATAGGLCLGASLPPIGWWPLSLAGWALIDLILANATGWARFWRMSLASLMWIGTSILWMWDLIGPAYIVVTVAYATWYGAAAVAATGRWQRRFALPAAVVLTEFVRWSWPFGGVPLANVALSQIDAPWAPMLRVVGPFGLVAAAVIMGQLGAQLIEWRSVGLRIWALAPAGLVAALAVGGTLHPRATVIEEIDVALVQGGGPQNTRATASETPIVLGRHLEASKSIVGPVDLVVWPENVVNPAVGLSYAEAESRVGALAAELNAPVSAGWFHRTDDGTANVNYQAITLPDGSRGDRYDKVRVVPFGEYVPLRSFIESGPLAPMAADAPLRDVVPGDEPAVLDTPVGLVGTLISWEGFFDTRARSAVNAGAVLLTNPTNGSSYWLDQVHTQQVASNRMWALAYDRWNLQVGPTGLSAVIDPDGRVEQRTDLRERAVLQATVELREGRTVASRVGPWPMLVAAGLSLLGVWVLKPR